MTDSFIFYASFAEAASELSNEQYGALMRAINEYALYDREPELSGVPKMLFILIKPQLDANKKRRENAKKGGAPSGNANAQKQPMVDNSDEEKQPTVDFSETKKQPNANANANGNGNGNGNDIGADAPAPDGASPTESKRFVKPTLAQVAEYCRDRGNNVNPERWYAHYESNGWKVGKSPMKDWQAAVRTWEHNNFDRPRTTSPPIAGVDSDFDTEAMAAIFNGGSNA